MPLPEEVARQSHSGRQQCSAGEEDDTEVCKSAQADPQPGYYPGLVFLLVRLADLAQWVPKTSFFVPFPTNNQAIMRGRDVILNVLYSKFFVCYLVYYFFYTAWFSFPDR